MATFPEPDLDRIAKVAAQLAVLRKAMWRLHAPTHASYPVRWDELRTFGPLPTARFDPWLPPLVDHAPEGVGYFGFDVPTCLAEVFQTNRHVNTTRNALQLTAFTPRRHLRLLDVRDTWPISIGASHALNSGPKNRCRRWAHALRTVHSASDGLLFIGMAGRDCVALYTPPGGAFPDLPDFTKPLSDPGLASRIADGCEQIGYALD